MKISNDPIKGMSDWFPEEFRIRKYIFDVWRNVCITYGYEEYMTPLLETAQLYRAKSGEDVGGKELMVVTDRAGRELAIRPEMTPSVTRLVSRMYPKAVKPIRLFSIANFVRNEKPQRGRNREFWQLNLDLFGSELLTADVEILQMALEIMLGFHPPEGSFKLLLNNRKLLDVFLLDCLKINMPFDPGILRIFDKWTKLPFEEFATRLHEVGIAADQVSQVKNFLSCTTIEELTSCFPVLKGTEGVEELSDVMKKLSDMGYAEYVAFSPSILRGFDYYTGIVFEVFDQNPENNRSMFGGGRYNGLSSLFGSEQFSAVGCAPGDEPLYLFLQSWNLLENVKHMSAQRNIFIPLLPGSSRVQIELLANSLRKHAVAVVVGLAEQGITKSLQYANKNKYAFVLLAGGDELERKKIIVKDMQSSAQYEFSMDEVQTKVIQLINNQ